VLGCHSNISFIVITTHFEGVNVESVFAVTHLYPFPSLRTISPTLYVFPDSHSGISNSSFKQSQYALSSSNSPENPGNSIAFIFREDDLSRK
jgi:hypothetical protein